MMPVEPEEFFPAVYDFLVAQGLSKTAKQFLQEASLSNVPPPQVSMVKIYSAVTGDKRPREPNGHGATPAPVPVASVAGSSAPAPEPAAKRKAGEHSNTPFKRVDPDKITFDKEGLADNSWDYLRAKGHTYADKAQERLGPVKGKAFQKQMTKAKRGTYRGGAIDSGAVNSIKY